MGKGKVIGGMVLFGESQGAAAAEIALKILDRGMSPTDIYPIIGDRGRYLFSKSELKKFNLTLPERISRRAQLVD